MKNRKKSAVAVLLAAAMMTTLLAGCGGAKSKVEETISSFESACQSLDTRGMLECINPAVSQPLLNALDLFGVEDTSGTLEQLAAWMDLVDSSGEVTEEFVRSIQIQPEEFEFNDAKDRCTVTAQLSRADSEPETITLKMILKDDVWYISSFGG